MSACVHPGTYIRHSRRNPCPVCGKPDWCRSFPDGATECMRIESPTPCVSGGWMHWPSGERPVDWRDRLAALPPPPPLPAIDDDLANAVYETILALCPLAAVDRADLHCRGFTDEQIARHGYGSWPDDPVAQRRIVAAVIAKRGEGIVGKVPGFYRDDDGQPALACSPGRLQRVVRDGRVIRFKVRRRGVPGGGKFRHVSSSDRPGGVLSPAMVHEAVPPGYAGTSTRLGFVEGIDKANMAADRLRIPVVAVASLGSTRDLVAMLRKHGATEAVMLFDMDRLTNEQVRRHEQATVDHLRSHGFAVLRGSWVGHKGIDDALAAGVLPVLESTAPTGATVERIAELEARVDELTEELRTERADRNLEHRILGDNRRPAQERISAVVFNWHANRVAKHGSGRIGRGGTLPQVCAVDETGGVLTSVKLMADASGTSPKNMGDYLAKWQAEGVISKTVTRVATGEAANPKTGEIRPTFESTARVRPRGNLADFLHDLYMGAPTPAPRKKPVPKDRCLDHPDANLIRRVTVECAVCHQQIGDERISEHTAGTPPELQAEEARLFDADDAGDECQNAPQVISDGERPERPPAPVTPLSHHGVFQSAARDPWSADVYGTRGAD